ncbi:MAG: hypothetical protein AAFZ18_17815 [Myxococcota bacterium]
MKPIIALRLVLLGLLPLTTAGTPSCPTCVDVDWTLTSKGVDLAGGALGSDVVAAILVIDGPTAQCQLDLPVSVVATDLPWNLELDYGYECGSQLGGSKIHVDRGQGLEVGAVLVP